jgi:hypothetical protein
MELRHRLLGFPDLVCHRAAGIEDHAHRDSCVLCRKRSDLLFHLVVEHLEVALLKTGYNPVVGIRNRNVHEHRINVNLDWNRVYGGLAERSWASLLRRLMVPVSPGGTARIATDRQGEPTRRSLIGQTVIGLQATCRRKSLSKDMAGQ